MTEPLSELGEAALLSNLRYYMWIVEDSLKAAETAKHKADAILKELEKRKNDRAQPNFRRDFGMDGQRCI